MIQIVHSICAELGLTLTNISPETGGDISNAFVVTSIDKQYFIKINDAQVYPEMFAKEAEGLECLARFTSMKVPAVVATGVLASRQYLVLEYLPVVPINSNFWRTFGDGVAALHKNSNALFGWHSFNYIGSIVQQNNYTETWASFYAEQRIMPMVKRLFVEEKFSLSDVATAEIVCNKLSEIFPAEAPALLHGDLWRGNFMCTAIEGNGAVPAIYDPAIYYGHREMDIGMSLLFGGFDNQFYDAYNEAFPLERNWRARVSLTQLYPLLVHAILFGGAYVSQCRQVLHQWK